MEVTIAENVFALTHFAPFFSCAMSVTLLPARLVGVTVPLAVTLLPSLMAPLVRPLSLSVTLGGAGGATVTMKLAALVALPPGVVTAIGPLLAPADSWAAWEPVRRSIRIALLSDSLLMSFKRLGDGQRRRALQPLLNAANSLDACRFPSP